MVDREHNSQGLYTPELEHDACGIGFVAHLKNRKSHEVVTQALDMLARMEHRGANGFQPENALSREQTLKGMTIWAAYSNFDRHEKGSVEIGKFADFVILDKNIMEIEESKIPSIKIEGTYIAGIKVN